MVFFNIYYPFKNKITLTQNKNSEKENSENSSGEYLNYIEF